MADNKPIPRHNHKLTTEQFLEFLRANGGIYSRTARAITAATGHPITRQAVWQRAQRHKEQLNDIQQENIDVAEENLFELIRAADSDAVKLQAIKYYLDNIGKIRGYGKGSDIDVTHRVVPPDWEIVETEPAEDD